MIPVQDLRNGTAFLMDGAPWICLKYEHIKMGRGSATIKVKVRNMLTGSILEKGFINSARVEEINTARKAMQYLYKDGAEFVFMDPKSFEQVSLPADVVGEQGAYLMDDIIVNILFWDDRPLWLELPPKMQFTIKETDPGIKGNSASNMYKSAVLDNGLAVRVPLFIEEGEKIWVDTRDGSYVERVKA